MKKSFFIYLLLSVLSYSCKQEEIRNSSRFINMYEENQESTLADNSFCIHPGEIGLTDSNSQRYILGSIGAQSSVIVIFYDPSTNQAGISHIDGDSNIDQTLSLLKEELNKDALNGNNRLIAYLGTLENNETLNSIIERLKLDFDKDDIKILKSHSLSIDTKSGQIKTNVSSAEIGMTHDRLIRSQHERLKDTIHILKGEKTNSKICFDGRKNDSLNKNLSRLNI